MYPHQDTPRRRAVVAGSSNCGGRASTVAERNLINVKGKGSVDGGARGSSARVSDCAPAEPAGVGRSGEHASDGVRHSADQYQYQYRYVCVAYTLPHVPGRHPNKLGARALRQQRREPLWRTHWYLNYLLTEPHTLQPVSCVVVLSALRDFSIIRALKSMGRRRGPLTDVQQQAAA